MLNLSAKRPGNGICASKYFHFLGKYAMKNYKENTKVIKLAKKVEKQSKIYKKQLKDCSESVTKKKYIIF